jgi:hypothetical protein
MFLTFERLSTLNEVGRHRELRCPRCERWPQLVKLEPNAVCLFECRCGAQIWERAPTEAASKVRDARRSKRSFMLFAYFQKSFNRDAGEAL